MAHPYAAHRQNKVEKERVTKIAGPVPAGINHTDEAADRKLIKGLVKPSALRAHGGKSGSRLDRYARGGKVKKGTTVNVVIAPQGGGDKAPMPVPVPAAAGPAPVPPPKPPMLPPGGPPGMPPGMPPGAPPMMPRKHGGRAGYKRGGAVKSGPAWDDGLRNGTPVEHDPGKNDTDKINKRPALLTRKRGGRAYPLTAGADSGEGRLQRTKSQKSFKAP